MELLLALLAINPLKYISELCSIESTNKKALHRKAFLLVDSRNLIRVIEALCYL